VNEVWWRGPKKSENVIFPSYEKNVVDGKSGAGEQTLSDMTLLVMTIRETAALMMLKTVFASGEKGIPRSVTAPIGV
jgi:hypothetical protein